MTLACQARTTATAFSELRLTDVIRRCYRITSGDQLLLLPSCIAEEDVHDEEDVDGQEDVQCKFLSFIFYWS